MPKRTTRHDITESRVETRSSRRRKIQKNETVYPDPVLGALPWDCASMVFEYLELPDVARCEQVCRAWRTFVQEWMVERGYHLHLPERWRPDFRISQTIEEQVATMKKSVVGHEKYNKITSGRVSDARAIRNAQCFEVNGDFAAWKIGKRLFGQRLGFQADGSPYRTRSWDIYRNCSISGQTTVHVSPGGYIVARVSSHKGYLDQVVSIPTGKHQWRSGSEAWERTTQWPEIRGVSASRLYYVALEKGSSDKAYLLVHDLATGALLHRSYITDYRRLQKRLGGFRVRRLADMEVLVAFCVSATDEMAPSPYFASVGNRTVVGFLVINPEDGSTLQIFEAPFCQDKYRWGDMHYVESRMIPSTEDEGDFAVVCQHLTAAHWVFKVERFSANADGAFHRIGTDMITAGWVNDMGAPDMLDPELDPFNSLCLDIVHDCNFPRITAMEACCQSDLGNQEDIPRHAGVEVDRWFRSGKQTDIACALKTKVDTGRRPLVIRSTEYRLRYAGANRLVVEPTRECLYGENHVHTLLDFAFRRTGP